MEEQPAAMTTERFDLTTYLNSQFKQSPEENLSAPSILSERILNLNVENKGLHAQVPRALYRLTCMSQVPLRAVTCDHLGDLTLPATELSACCCQHPLQRVFNIATPCKQSQPPLPCGTVECRLGHAGRRRKRENRL